MTKDDLKTSSLQAVSVVSPLRDATSLIAVLEKLRQGLCVFDHEQRLVLFNDLYARIYRLDPNTLREGMTLKEVIDLRFAAGTGPDMTAEDYAGWRDQVASDNQTSETIVRLRDGRRIEIHHKPISDGGWVSTHDDITERLAAAARLAASEARLRTLTDALPQMVWVSGEHSEITYRNAPFEAYHGQIGNSLAERVDRNHPEDAERMCEVRRVAVSAGKPFSVEGRLRRHDGVYRWHRLSLVPVKLDGAITEWLATALDIDEIVAAREALRTSEERLAFALDAGSDGLWDCDAGSGKTWYSDRWFAMLGYAQGELPGHTDTWLRILHPDDRAEAVRRRDLHLEGALPVFEHEHRLIRRDGKWMWVHTRGKVVERDQDGQALRIVGTSVDIDARKVAEERIVHLARHDHLTGLPNRGLFLDQLSTCFKRIEVGGRQCAILFLDLDRFKNINDTLGHPAGDVLLRDVASRFSSLLRPGEILARLGGDEFVVLIGSDSDRTDLEGLAASLIEAAQRPTLGEQELSIGLSIGIARAPRDAIDSETLLKHADLALYCAKFDGRNTFRFYEADMGAAESEHRKMEMELREAIRSDQLLLHYQPLVSGETGAVVGYEALVRWRHPSRGLVFPGSFIPLAEKTGLIGPLGDWVLLAACRAAAQLPSHISIAVNLSPLQFQNVNLPNRVLEVLNATGLSPSRLEVEITEGVMIRDLPRAIQILRRLKSLGIRIAVDDFGTGYSSLTILQAFPFDKIKIDRSFVAQLQTNAQAAAIVHSVIDLGRGLGMCVVAEGVENSEQLRFLQEERCHELQGFLFGRPLPLEAVLQHQDSAPRYRFAAQG